MLFHHHKDESVISIIPKHANNALNNEDAEEPLREGGKEQWTPLSSSFLRD